MTNMRFAADTGNRLPTHILYLVSYKNEGRREAAHTETKQGAARTATTLKAQGAQSIRITPPRDSQT